jgi:predicted ATP-dependent serine protease
MAIEQARICGACGRESPSWADRCPVCGSLSLVHRITILAASPIATISPKAGRKKARRARMAGHEPPRVSPARSTA